MLLAAEALFTEGKFTEATSQFERFTKEYPSSPLCAGAALGIAACLEAQNKPAEALTAYQAVTTRYAESPVTAQARLAVGRLHELAKHPDQALRIYDELSKPTSTSAWAGEARQRREALLKAHPELVPTNAVPALPTPTLSAGGSNPAPLVTSNAPAPQLRP